MAYQRASSAADGFVATNSLPSSEGSSGLLAAAAPTIALLLGASGMFAETAAVWLTLGIGFVTLAVEGLRFARLERLALTGTAIAMGLNIALGLAIGALKVEAAH